MIDLNRFLLINGLFRPQHDADDLDFFAILNRLRKALESIVETTNSSWQDERGSAIALRRQAPINGTEELEAQKLKDFSAFCESPLQSAIDLRHEQKCLLSFIAGAEHIATHHSDGLKLTIVDKNQTTSFDIKVDAVGLSAARQISQLDPDTYIETKRRDGIDSVSPEGLVRVGVEEYTVTDPDIIGQMEKYQNRPFVIDIDYGGYTIRIKRPLIVGIRDASDDV